MRRFEATTVDDVDRRQRLQRQIEDGAADAIERLRRVARGEENFVTDHALRACIAMARMARLIIVKITPPAPARSIAHPDNSPEENERLIAALESGMNDPDRDAPVQRYWLEGKAHS